MERTRKVLGADEIRRIIMRIAHEIVEKNDGSNNLVIIGIRTGGAYIAKRLQKNIQAIEGREVPMGVLDITLYRDDLSEYRNQPNLR